MSFCFTNLGDPALTTILAAALAPSTLAFHIKWQPRSHTLWTTLQIILSPKALLLILGISQQYPVPRCIQTQRSFLTHMNPSFDLSQRDPGNTTRWSPNSRGSPIGFLPFLAGRRLMSIPEALPSLTRRESSPKENPGDEAKSYAGVKISY